MTNSSPKKVLVAICGGVAAYKACELVRRLHDRGVSVRVIMTQAATEFVTPLLLQALSGYPVVTDWQSSTADNAMSHIEVARWADAVIIAPLTANSMANLAMGKGQDVVSAMCLATAAPVFFAPAMNQQMWQHAAVQKNLQRCITIGYHYLGVASGAQACGEVGAGRMLEPDDIIKTVFAFYEPGPLSNCRVVITAGPTREYIDPIRFISNHSSGKMGYALAQAAQHAGAEVILISGPVSLPCPAGVQRIMVESAIDMQQAVNDALQRGDIFVAAAAVGDYRVMNPALEKQAKQPEMNLQLTANPDILQQVAARDDVFTVGFAAQTHNVAQFGRAKYQTKQCDMLCINDVSDKRIGFYSDDNALTVLYLQQSQYFPQQAKSLLAKNLIQLIQEQYHVKYPQYTTENP